MKVALDTNVLVYAQGQNDVHRIDIARRVLAAIPVDNIVLPLQALGELYWVLVRKASMTRHAARDAVLAWQDTYAVAHADMSDFLAALDMSANHQLSMWDAIILTTAARARCRILLSEDLSEGFTWQGLTVVNPFADNPHPLLQAALASAS